MEEIFEALTAFDKENPTRNEWITQWTVRWQHCNNFCLAYIVFDWMALLGHWGMMIVPLQGWAGGSLLLIFETYLTSMMTMFSMMLMVGEPVWMMAPRWQRMFVFVWALIAVSSYFGQAIGLIFGYFRGNQPFDSFTEIVLMYLFTLRFADFIPAVYVVLFEGLAQNEYSLFNENYGNWITYDDLRAEEEGHFSF